jgi:hypothetical protein
VVNLPKKDVLGRKLESITLTDAELNIIRQFVKSKNSEYVNEWDDETVVNELISYLYYSS